MVVGLGLGYTARLLGSMVVGHGLGYRARILGPMVAGIFTLLSYYIFVLASGEAILGHNDTFQNIVF